MNELSGTDKTIILLTVGFISLIAPLGFIFMWGPQRFEKREKKVK